MHFDRFAFGCINLYRTRVQLSYVFGSLFIFSMLHLWWEHHMVAFFLILENTSVGTIERETMPAKGWHE